MLFNSVDFAVFLPLVFGLYWLLGTSRRKAQNVLILLSSYFFYAWWNWQLLGLILLSTAIDFWAGQEIHASSDRQSKKRWLALSIGVNIGLLLFFKYCNFFIDSFATAFQFLGYSFTSAQLEIALPVGISFYTFQTLSYSIDIYRKQLEPTTDWIAFGAFVSFFPQLVAGPIERAKDLLPQFHQQRSFSYLQARDGLQQLFWGLFKKVAIADQCAPLVDHIFQFHDQYSGGTLLLGALLFSFQIYADFSGYSDMAIGTAKLFGFRLSQNFSTPYFATNIRQFWQKWHISLTAWFRDYLYISLGGNRKGRLRTVQNIIAVFLVSGLWHGAEWKFVYWGLMHAMLFIIAVYLWPALFPASLARPIRIVSVLKGVVTFLVVSIAWVFFRAENLEAAFRILDSIGNFPGYAFELPKSIPTLIPLLFTIALMLVIEWRHRTRTHGLQISPTEYPRWVRWSIYHSLLIVLLLYGKFNETTFIYFQF